MTDQTWLTPQVVEAVLGHMNTDHAADNAIICRGVGGAPEVTGAVCAAFDLDAVRFDAQTLDGPRVVTIAFSSPLADRAQVRAEFARMYHESAAMLGLPPRDPGH